MSTFWSRSPTPHRAHRRLVLAVVAVAVLLAGCYAARPTPPVPLTDLTPLALIGAAAADTSTSSSHPFGDPVWFPLRSPADIGCAKNACGAYRAHGYWALDLVAKRGDPVHAAGAGILHVGGRSNACAPSRDAERDGNWVWIDHGAGVVTRYHHLDTIVARDGQLVTPATVIATMGHSGDTTPCLVNYLHFEIRTGGVKGTRVDPGQLKTCTAAGTVRVPAVVGGAAGWDDPAVHTRPRVRTPTARSDCLGSAWLRSPDRPAPTVSRGSQTVVVRWPAMPATVGTVAVGLETYHPSTRTYSGPNYVRLAGTATGHRFDGLENGRTYRFRVAAHSPGGWSRSSTLTRVVPAGRPGTPRAPRYAAWPKRDYVHYGWFRPAGHGSEVTSFGVAVRCGRPGSGYGRWGTYRQGPRDTYRNLRGLSAVSSCQLKVRGTNAAGTGGWSNTSTVRWKG